MANLAKKAQKPFTPLSIWQILAVIAICAFLVWLQPYYNDFFAPSPVEVSTVANSGEYGN